MTEFKVLAPVLTLGKGIKQDCFFKGLERDPDLIAIDTRVFLQQPYYLGRGKSFARAVQVSNELKQILEAAVSRSIPFLIGNAGGAGARVHLDWMENIISRLAKELDISFDIATINSQLNKNYVKKAFLEERIMPFAHNRELTSEDIKAAKRIVAQVGVEPVQKAFQKGGKVIVTGRIYPPSLFAALPIVRGFSPALSYHMGTILSTNECMLGTLTGDELIVESLDSESDISAEHIANFSFFNELGYICPDGETEPGIFSSYKLQGPAGILDFSRTKFLQEDKNMVRIKGTEFISRQKNRFKIEGAKLKGYKNQLITGIQNSKFISEIDKILEEIRKRVNEIFNNYNYDYELTFSFCGLTGVANDLELVKGGFENKDILELGLIVETIADSQELADNITRFVKSRLRNFNYDGKVVTAVSSVFPATSQEASKSEVYTFNICHLLESDDDEEEDGIFSIKVKEI